MDRTWMDLHSAILLLFCCYRRYEGNSLYLSNAAKTSRISMLLARKNKDRHYEWAYGPGDTPFFLHYHPNTALILAIKSKDRHTHLFVVADGKQTFPIMLIDKHA